MARTYDMTVGKPTALLARLALPMMMANICQLLYTVADSAVVGRLIGVSAFASVGAAGFYYWLIFDMVLGLTQGFGTVLAQRFGAKDAPGLRRGIAMAGLLSISIGAVFSLFGVLFARPLLALLNTPQDILPGTAMYLHYMLGGMIITFIYNLLSTILRSLGDSRTPLIAVVLASILNITLDILLVTLTPLGIAGVAIATLVSQVAACLWCLRKLSAIPDVRLTRADFFFDRNTLKALARLGVPMGLRNFIISLGGLFIQYYVNGYGTLFVAGVAATKRIYSLMEIVGGAIEGAVAVYVAQNFGARRMDRVRLGVRVARRILLVSSCAIALIVVVFGRQLVGLFLSPESADFAEVARVAQNQLLAMAIGLPSLYMLLMYRSSLQGMGNALMPTLSGFIELAMRVLSVLLLPALIGEWGVFVAEVLGWPVAALQLFIAYMVVYRREMN